MTPAARAAHVASVQEAAQVAQLLHAFNVEFDAETPGPTVLTRRLRALLKTRHTFAVLAGDPSCSVGLVTLRTNLWTAGRVALLDEMYTMPHRRGQGLGSAVLTLAVAEARRRGATEFEIEVDEPDADAHHFYARHGFPSRDPATGDRAFVLRRVLHPAERGD